MSSVKAFITTMMDAGRARRTVVELGRQAGQSAEVTAGLAEGTRVILHPGDTLVDGGRGARTASSELSHSWRSQGTLWQMRAATGFIDRNGRVDASSIHATTVF